jgi:hypothetical protein
MHERTRATLEQLNRIEWFRAVGQHDSDKVIILSSWEEAIEHCASIYWENLCLEARELYRMRLWNRNKARARQWNTVVDAVKPVTTALVERKINTVVRHHHLPEVFRDTVRWDMLHVALEAEFADVCEPSFYAGQAYWYVQGHFPCGWSGEPPGGTLIIY